LHNAQTHFQQGDKCNKLKDFNKIAAVGQALQASIKRCKRNNTVPVSGFGFFAISFQLMLSGNCIVQFTCTHKKHHEK